MGCKWVSPLAVLAFASALSMTPVAPLHAQVPGALTGSNDQIEEQLENEVEEQVQEEVQEEVADATEQVVEEEIDRLTLGVDPALEAIIEAQLEEEVANSVEEEVEESTEEIVEETVDDAIGDAVEEQIANTVTEELEENVEETVENSVENTVASQVEEAVTAEVEASVEESVAQSVEESVDAGIADQVEESVAGAVEETVESQLTDAIAMVTESRAEDVVDERLDTQIDNILDDLETNLEADEERIHSDQWLVMAEPLVFEELAEQGYLFDTVTDLPALGMRLAEVAGPSSFDITAVRRGVLDVVGKDRAEVDLNHIYTAGAETEVAASGLTPRAAAQLPAAVASEQMAPRIGMIDSLVDTSHPALAQAHINSRSFVADGATMPRYHGTAIASILVANSSDYVGLDPYAEIYAAAVFQQDEKRGEIASTVSLLRALDWLMASDVDVINISLAGPPNRLLETALKRVHERNILVLAAAGNGGPVSSPMYPAAYDTVVAVTAVDESHRVFRLANRGTYLDIAAPGVGLLHAKAGGGYAASSGTSFAVPFAASAAAALRRQNPGVDVMGQLYRSAEDLGPPGRDDIYGYGLLRFQGS
ncbi:S8 family serine peptidase [Haliea sp. E17]|uniref:S8 family serine peptidase n=1 Tax=Haliea sp. E17 TaxID=3401576 RepID=UPI003AABF534